MTNDQLVSFIERFVVSCEQIAQALEGLNETHRREYDARHPAPRPYREAIVTRVPNAEDKIKEAQGATTQSFNDWLTDIDQEEEENEFIGVRERSWIDAQKREGPGQEKAGSRR